MSLLSRQLAAETFIQVVSVTVRRKGKREGVMIVKFQFLLSLCAPLSHFAHAHSASCSTASFVVMVNLILFTESGLNEPLTKVNQVFESLQSLSQLPREYI